MRFNDYQCLYHYIVSEMSIYVDNFDTVLLSNITLLA